MRCTIAGSGPSVTRYDKSVTVATKKLSLPSEYIFCRFEFQYKGSGEPLMLYYNRGYDYKTEKIEKWYCDHKKWDAYYKKFIRNKRPPQRAKPSLGTCAVMGCVERWGVNEIGLIGFDNILDGNTDWEHDAVAEKACIESLVKIIDLRQG